MTQQDLGQDLALGTAPDDDARDASSGTLFDSSPARSVQTSAAAVIAFACGLLGVLAVPFSLAMALCAGLAAVALVASIVGMARASRPDVAGGLLASVGLVLALATLALVGLRYLGLDTAFGDGFVPTLPDWLDWLNRLLPTPRSDQRRPRRDHEVLPLQGPAAGPVALGEGVEVAVEAAQRSGSAALAL